MIAPVLLPFFVVGCSVLCFPSLAQESQDTKQASQADPFTSSLVDFDPTDITSQEQLLAPFREKASKWQADVDKLSASNSTDGSTEHVLFIGSSSFRLWDSIAEDLSSLKVLRRAYGGARYRDLAVHTPQLIKGLKFSKAVVFIANDITGSQQEDTDPETVSKLARLVIYQLRKEQPECQIHLLAVTPTPSRYKYWQRIQVINAMLKMIAQSTDNVFYIPTAYAFLDSDGRPRSELFKEDRLHLNPVGYQFWSEIILEALGSKDQDSK